MTSQKITVKQHAWLDAQLTLWQGREIVTSEQAGRILDLYESRAEQADRKRSLLIFALMGIAALFAGMGVFLLIGYNWEALRTTDKLIMIFGAVLGSYGAAFYVQKRYGATLGAEALYLSGCLMYGAAIFLIAQIFHLNAHYPDGVWWWAVGVLPIAFAMRTPLVHILLASLLALWCGMEILGFSSSAFPWWNLLPRGAYSLPLLALPGLIWGYWKNSKATVWLYVPVLAWWTVLQLVPWNAGQAIIYFTGMVGAFLLLIAQAHPTASGFARPYRFYGSSLLAGPMLLLSFHDFNESLLRRAASENIIVMALIIAGLTAVVIGATTSLERIKNKGALPVQALYLHLIRKQWFPLGSIVLLAFLMLWQVSIGDALLTTIAANVVVVVMALWTMKSGLGMDRGFVFAAGVIYFMIWAVSRYIDLFGDFGGMLGAALMFFLCSGTLFGMAMYWHKRRKISHAN